MSKLTLHINKPGLQTTIQDKGRKGQQHLGVPFGGPMDEKSADGANWLVGNKAGSALLEMTLIGPEIEFQGNGFIAITGANLSPQINNKEVALNKTLTISDGDILTFGACKYGCRSYLAVGGEWLVPDWLQSVSAYSNIFTPHSILKKKDTIDIKTTRPSLKQLLASQSMIFPQEVRVRVTKGPEINQFSKHELNQLLQYGHLVSKEANRMGYRLSTRLKNYTSHSELISSGIIPGTIQITNEGQPIILMKDAQTTGGYPRIATIIKEDLNIVGQLKPGDTIWFALI
ncbi:MAG: biotin-dependent carboxyltransferase family protein [Fulvivirga sp.]